MSLMNLGFRTEIGSLQNQVNTKETDSGVKLGATVRL